MVIPRLVCREVEGEIAFCADVLGAAQLGSRTDADGHIVHALLTIGPAMLMIEAEWPSLPSRAPAADGSSPVVIFVYVEDVDATVERALRHGARVLVPAKNQFWGDRTAWVVDPSGHVWTLASRIEATTESQRAERWKDIASAESSEVRHRRAPGT